MADFNLGNHPNLYAGGNEIGNFIPSFPFTLSGLGANEVDMSIISDTFHCPVLDGNAGVSNAGRYFNINPMLANVAEQQLLAEYGKVFFYHWEAIDPATMLGVAQGYIMPECDQNVVAGTAQVNTGLSVTVPNIPMPVSSDLYYHQSTDIDPFNTAPISSLELFLEHLTYVFEDTFMYNGTQYFVRAETSPGLSTSLTLSRF